MPSGAEHRKTVAPSVSCGFTSIADTSPGWGESSPVDTIGSVAPPGLKSPRTGNPALTRWATFCRCSAPRQRHHPRMLPTGKTMGSTRDIRHLIIPAQTRHPPSCPRGFARDNQSLECVSREAAMARRDAGWFNLRHSAFARSPQDLLPMAAARREAASTAVASPWAAALAYQARARIGFAGIPIPFSRNRA